MPRKGDLLKKHKNNVKFIFCRKVIVFDALKYNLSVTHIYRDDPFHCHGSQDLKNFAAKIGTVNGVVVFKSL